MGYQVGNVSEKSRKWRYGTASLSSVALLFFVLGEGDQESSDSPEKYILQGEKELTTDTVG